MAEEGSSASGNSDGTNFSAVVSLLRQAESSVIRVSSFHISVQIKVEMHSSKNMPAGEDIAILQFSLSWCMIR